MFNDQFFIQLLMLYNQELFYFYTYMHIQRERETIKKFAYPVDTHTHTHILHQHPTSIFIYLCNICPIDDSQKANGKIRNSSQHTSMGTPLSTRLTCFLPRFRYILFLAFL